MGLLLFTCEKEKAHDITIRTIYSSAASCEKAIHEVPPSHSQISTSN